MNDDQYYSLGDEPPRFGIVYDAELRRIERGCEREQDLGAYLLTLCVLKLWVRSEPKCWPSQKTLADRLGCAVSTVRRRVKKLEKWDVLKREWRVTSTGGAHLYCFPLDSRDKDTTDDGNRAP